MGGNRALSFYRRDELSRRKAIRSDTGSVFRSVFFRGGETAGVLLHSGTPTGLFRTSALSFLSPSVVDPLAPLSYLMTPSPRQNSFPFVELK